MTTTPKFQATGQRTKIEDASGLIIQTCGRNDTAEKGSATIWAWSNPTNLAIRHRYLDIEATSVEALWQGTKITAGATGPNLEILAGAWRKGKGRRPLGAYAGSGKPLLSLGAARRAIYLPAYQNLVKFWLRDKEVQSWVAAARAHKGQVYLRDFTTGQGLDNNKPMSHAWLLSVWLNTGRWPA